jgi:hypothetical protein
MMDYLNAGRDPITIPKLKTDNYDIWFEQLCFALDYRNLKKYISFKNYEDFCQGQCMEISGFKEEIFQINDVSLEYNEEEFMENIILPSIQQRLTLKMSKPMVDNMRKQRKYYLELLEDFDQQVKFKEEKKKCMSFIISTISDPVRDRIKGEESPYILISKLKVLCPSSSLGQIINVKRQIYHAAMGDKELLISFLDRVEALNRKIVDSKFRLSEIDLWMAVVMNLHPRYSTLATVLISGNVEDATLDKLRNQFANDDARSNRASEKKDNNELVNNSFSSKGTKFKKNKGKTSVGQTQKNKTFNCFRCGKEGHKASDCHASEKDMETFKKNSEKSGTLKSDSNSSNKKEDKGLITVDHCFSIYDDDSYLDSGTSKHVVKNRELLYDVKEVNSNLSGAFGRPVVVKEQGSIDLNCDKSIELKDALFHPRVKLNLISISRLMKDNGLNVLFDKDQMKAFIFDPDQNEVVAQAKLQDNGLFKIETSENNANVVGQVNTCNSVYDTLENWHKRLGHINLKSIKDLNERGHIHIKDLKTNLEIDCETCRINKATRKNFKKERSVVAKNFGDVIHTDVGVYEKRSLGGNYYFISFIDEATRLKNVYFMKTKDEAFGKFKIFRKWFKNQFNFNFKKINCDGGGEYLMSKEFKDFLTKKGIEPSITPPNTPQLNGIAERFNRTLEEGVRCILREAELPDKFWGEALAYIVFIRNRIPRKNQIKSPFELVFKRKPAFKYLQQFGARIKYLNTYKKKKLEPRAINGIFMGYTQDDFIFKVWDEEKQMMFRSRDISFDKNVFIKTKSYNSSSLEKNKKEEEAEIKNYSEESESEIPIIDDSDNFKIEKKLDFKSRNSNLGGEKVIPEVTKNSPINISSSEEEEQNEDSSSEEIIEKVPVLRRSSRTHVDRDDPNYYSRNRAEWKKADDALRNRPLMQDKIDSNALMVHCFNTLLRTEPISFSDAMKRDDANEWQKSILIENENLKNNGTWEEIKPWELPKDALIVDSRWVFKYKTDSDNNIFYKARLVAKGYTQIPGIHYEEVTSPVTRYATVRFIIAFAANRKYEIDQVDVVSAFLNGDLKENIYLRLPEGVEVEHSNVVKLKKSIYGLKQSSRNWFLKFVQTILEYGFIESHADSCLFTKKEGNDLLIILIYVDDGLIVGPRAHVDKIKSFLFKRFKMRNLGEAKKFLSLEISKNDDYVAINQQSFIDKIVKKFGMENSKTRRTPLNAGTKERTSKSDEDLFEKVNIYQQAVGSLLYLANGTRPDISFAVGLMSRKLISPSQNDWANVKSIIAYVGQTRDLALKYFKKESKLEGFCDSSFADGADSKSTSGYLFKFGDAAISWRSTKQKIVAVNTMEAELISVFDAVKEALWLQKISKDLCLSDQPIILFCDNKSAIYWIANNDYSDRSKHMSVRLRRIEEEIKNNQILVKFIRSENQIADITTKALGKNLFKRFSERLGLSNLVPIVSNLAHDEKSKLRGSVGVNGTTTII